MIIVHCLEMVTKTETGPLSLETFSADNEGEATEKVISSFSERLVDMCAVKFENLYKREDHVSLQTVSITGRYCQVATAVHCVMQWWLCRQDLQILSSPKARASMGSAQGLVSSRAPGRISRLWKRGAAHFCPPPVFFGYVKLGNNHRLREAERWRMSESLGEETGKKKPKRTSESRGSSERGREWGGGTNRGTGGERVGMGGRGEGAGSEQWEQGGRRGRAQRERAMEEETGKEEQKERSSEGHRKKTEIRHGFWGLHNRLSLGECEPERG